MTSLSRILLNATPLLRRLRLLRSGRPPLVVPARFNRNSPTVTSLMTPEESGRWLLDRMRQQIGFDDYADKSLLDFGCGVRFSQAILNGPLRIRAYTGVDVHRALIEFLQRRVRDDRFSYLFLNAHHEMYNPRGHVLTPDSALPLGSRTFDVVCMFSVITHQSPDQSRSILSMLRRHVDAGGHLFFTCFLDDTIPTFEDRSARRNGGKCFYNPGFLTDLVEGCGWNVVTRVAGEAPLIGDSFVCQPAHTAHTA